MKSLNLKEMEIVKGGYSSCSGLTAFNIGLSVVALAAIPISLGASGWLAAGLLATTAQAVVECAD